MPRVIRWLLLVLGVVLFHACAPVKKPEPPPPDAFLFVTARTEDSYESLAQAHLNDPKLAWLIREANGNVPIRSGSELIIPLKPWRYGGLSAQGYQLVPVLCYHHFSHQTRKKLTTKAADFERQLEYLQDHGYAVITMDELLQFLDFGAVPRKAVMISIDDGWRDAYTVAYPLLKRYRTAATLFIPVRYIYAPSRRTMKWDMIREMISDTSVDIQSHTKTHRDLTEWPKGMSLARYLREVDREIEEGHQAILKETGRDSQALAYPFGRSNDVVIGILKKHGYQAGFTVERGGNAFFEDRFMLKRSMIFGDFDLDRFRRELVTFEDYPLTTPEPIDTAESLKTIAGTDPQQFEERQQWRTALLAWRLYRDRWLDQPDKIAKAETRIRALGEKLQKEADAFYQKALSATDQEQRKRNVLLALLYHPQHQKALELLRQPSGHFIRYRVKAGDSLRKLALKFYREPRYQVLIEAMNPQLDTSGPLPVGAELLMPRDVSVVRPERTEPSRCGVKLTTPPKHMAQQLYDEAVDFFNQDQIPKAIELLKTATCLDPDHKDARQLLDMLQKL